MKFVVSILFCLAVAVPTAKLAWIQQKPGSRDSWDDSIQSETTKIPSRPEDNKTQLQETFDPWDYFKSHSFSDESSESQDIFDSSRASFHSSSQETDEMSPECDEFPETQGNPKSNESSESIEYCEFYECHEISSEEPDLQFFNPFAFFINVIQTVIEAIGKIFVPKQYQLDYLRELANVIEDVEYAGEAAQIQDSSVVWPKVEEGDIPTDASSMPVPPKAEESDAEQKKDSPKNCVQKLVPKLMECFIGDMAVRSLPIKCIYKAVKDLIKCLRKK